jgi:hypothetical protein
MLAISGTLLIILGCYGFLEFRLRIGFIATLFLMGAVLFCWQLLINIRVYRNRNGLGRALTICPEGTRYLIQPQGPRQRASFTPTVT